MATNFVGFIHRMYFRTLVDGAVYGCRWTQAASGAAGRAKRSALQCV